MGDPTTSSVHTETVAGEKKKCRSCGKEYGGGYKSCPHCTGKDKDVSKSSSNARIGRTGLPTGMGKFPPKIDFPRATSPRDNDPRVHSHPFTADPQRPAVCVTCGMGTGAHGRMVDKPRTSTAEAMMDPGMLAKNLSPDASPTLVTKESPEHRYTLGPVYVPDSTDAHGDWVDAPSLQTAVWDYVRKTGANRTIFLQHSPRPAGEWVEILTWPYAVEVELQVPGQVAKSVTTFPKNTPFMGVIWEPWAWNAVKDGNLLGFSMGGRAQRTVAHISKDAAALLKHGNHNQLDHGNWSRGRHLRETVSEWTDSLLTTFFGPETDYRLDPEFAKTFNEIRRERAFGDRRATVNQDGIPEPAVGTGRQNRILFSHPQADAVNAKLRAVEAIEPEVTRNLVDIAIANGGGMTGLEFRLKDAGGIRPARDTNGYETTGMLNKIERKVAQKGMSPDAAVNSISDALRYTMTFNSSDYATSVSNAVDSMSASGYRFDEIENNWAKGDAYNGINAVFTHPTGEKVEIQFHTPESWMAKMGNHPEYEYLRKTSGITSRRVAAQYKMQRISDAVPMPDPSVHDIGEPVFRPLSS